MSLIRLLRHLSQKKIGGISESSEQLNKKNNKDS